MGVLSLALLGFTSLERQGDPDPGDGDGITLGEAVGPAPGFQPNLPVSTPAPAGSASPGFHGPDWRDLALEWTSSETRVKDGDWITLAIQVKNRDRQAVKGIQVHALVAPGLRLAGVEATGKSASAQLNPQTGKLRVRLGELGAGQAQTIIVRVQVEAAASGEQNLFSYAYLTYSGRRSAIVQLTQKYTP
jgi:hypothetical protein